MCRRMKNERRHRHERDQEQWLTIDRTCDNANHVYRWCHFGVSNECIRLTIRCWTIMSRDWPREYLHCIVTCGRFRLNKWRTCKCLYFRGTSGWRRRKSVGCQWRTYKTSRWYCLNIAWCGRLCHCNVDYSTCCSLCRQSFSTYYVTDMETMLSNDDYRTKRSVHHWMFPNDLCTGRSTLWMFAVRRIVHCLLLLLFPIDVTFVEDYLYPMLAVSLWNYTRKTYWPW
jgi:hypothetical protein